MKEPDEVLKDTAKKANPVCRTETIRSVNSDASDHLSEKFILASDTVLYVAVKNTSTHSVDSESVSHLSDIKRVCLIGSTRNSKELRDAVQKLNLECISDVDDSFQLEGDTAVAFVLPDFEATLPVSPSEPSEFNPKAVMKQLNGHRLFGPSLIIECATNENPVLPEAKADHKGRPRPLFCNIMKDIVVAFARFEGHHNVFTRLNYLVHWMGGSVRRSLRESLNQVTHVVAKVPVGSNFRLAVSYGKPVMDTEWILKAWERRFEPFSSALTPQLMRCTLKALQGLKLCFEGFSQLELQDIKQRTEANGGIVVENYQECDHLIVNLNTCFDYSTPDDIPPGVSVVTAEWFWLSIQLETCAHEQLYSVDKSAAAASIRGLPSRLLQSSNKRKSDASALRRNDQSLSLGSLDNSADLSNVPEHIFSTDDIEVLVNSPRKSMSKRQQICLELLQTENNYVQILSTIITIFKDPLHENTLLDDLEIREIFSSLPKIYEVHQEILKELTNIIAHWSETRLIGQVWIDKAECLKEAYPPFVNFFERSKEALSRCAKNNQRFYAFLKAGESKPECGRQSLEQLLIRPVQRLPSVQLLLTDIMKHTDKSNPDRQRLEQALDHIKQALTHINQEKGKAQGHFRLFSMATDIQDFPAVLVSAQRQVLAEVEVIELTDKIGGKGAKTRRPLYLYLFNDSLEIVKIRSANKAKPYRHLELLRLSHIKRVVNIGHHEGSNDCFYLITRGETDVRENRLVFQLTSKHMSKSDFLRQLCKAVADFLGNANKETDLLCVNDVLNTDDVDCDNLNSTLNKLANHAGKRMARAISFTRTPGNLKRTLSNLSNAMGTLGGNLKRVSQTNLRMHLDALPESPQASVSTRRVSRLNSTQSLFATPSFRMKSRSRRDKDVLQ